jgi:predicted SprT family Zn-dependent metalloprotease
MAAELLDDLCARFPMGYKPKLIWKNLRVTAGIAYYDRGAIALSRLLLIDEARVRDTLCHEYAHLLAVHRRGRVAAGHGKHWKQAMADIGAPARIYHSFPAQRNQKRQQVGYRCERCGAVIVRWRRLPHNRRYVHTKCGGQVSFQWVKPVNK